MKTPLIVPIERFVGISDICTNFAAEIVMSAPHVEADKQDREMKSRLRIAVMAVGLLAGFAAPVSGQKPALAMLNGLDPGRWELRVRGSGGPA